MPSKRYILFAADLFTAQQLLAQAIQKTIGLEVKTLPLTEYAELEQDYLQEYNHPECVILLTESGTSEEQAVEIYNFWREHLPATPFVWCHSDGNGYGSDEEWAAKLNGKWPNVKLVDVEVNTDRMEAYDYLLKILNKIAE